MGFALIIAVGTILLRLPIASHVPGGISWLDALFTATSAVTVTGLSLFSVGTYYTTFGQLVILLLLQVGGAGPWTLTVLATLITIGALGFCPWRQHQHHCRVGLGHESHRRGGTASHRIWTSDAK